MREPLRFSGQHWWNLVLVLVAAAGIVAWHFRVLDGRVAAAAVLGWVALGFVVSPAIMYEHLGFLDRQVFHDYFKANLRYRKAIETGIATSQGFCALSRLNLAEGDAQAAVELLEEAVKKLPEDHHLFALMSRALSRAGRHEEAIAAALRCRKLHGRHPLSDEVLADALKAKGDYLSAAAAYQEALKKDPGLVRSRVNLSAAYLMLGEVKAAEREIAEALRLRPRDPDALYWAGRIAQAKGDLEPAASYLRSALEVRPLDDKALAIPYQEVLKAYASVADGSGAL